ncbi:MAG: 2-oxoglutarate oxidoreductase [Acidobacteria bacterium]|nr:MAG: 2-oxoglutarate oxidoreductase [Acidobacteriota bacterium]
MYGLKDDWELEPRARRFVLEDYQGATPRWCPGCGDHAILNALQRLARDEQLPPEKTVVVSGIGCSSRLPHYMKTYGFHGLHGRPLPVACGVRSRRPDLNIFVITGDGDCCAIGTAHWIHAIRYNMKMTVMMFDNNIYGLTKMQSSPTTPKKHFSFTHPGGAPLSPINPLAVTLGVRNLSFLAQTIDWNPPHLYATLRAAHKHEGLAFVRILQRCPHFMPEIWTRLQEDPQLVMLLEHPEGIQLEDAAKRLFKRRREHDPHDLAAAHEIVNDESVVPIGLIYKNENAERYDAFSSRGIEMTTEEKLAAAQQAIDRFLI